MNATWVEYRCFRGECSPTFNRCCRGRFVCGSASPTLVGNVVVSKARISSSLIIIDEGF